VANIRGCQRASGESQGDIRLCYRQNQSLTMSCPLDFKMPIGCALGSAVDYGHDQIIYTPNQDTSESKGCVEGVVCYAYTRQTV
jgi:hypothetical protein